MKIKGERVIPASQDRVWTALNDPDILAQSIPGCESFEQLSEDSFRASVVSRIGPIQAKFTGTVRLSDLDPPNGYTITGEGSGGSAGGAKGVAKVRLEPVGQGTKLTYEGDAQVSGKLAQIGSRLVDSAVSMMAGQFFDRFQQVVTGGKPSAAPVSPVPNLVWIAVAVGLGVLTGLLLLFIL